MANIALTKFGKLSHLTDDHKVPLFLSFMQQYASNDDSSSITTIIVIHASIVFVALGLTTLILRPTILAIFTEFKQIRNNKES